MEQVDVVIVGAGLAGLTAAAAAAGRGRSVVVLDGQAPGGRARTDVVRGFRFNRGAHALYVGGVGNSVLDRLGVHLPSVLPPLKGARGRRGDRLGMLPAGPLSLARTDLVSAKGKVRLVRALAGARRWRPATLADRTVSTWFDELGLDGDERDLVAMLTRTATYVADHEVASADVAAGQLQLALGAGVRYLHGGWGRLIDELATKAARAGAELRAGAAVSRIEPEAGRTSVHAADGRALLARQVILASGPPKACAALLEESPTAWTDAGPEAAAACLDLGFDHVPDVTVVLGVDRPVYLIRHAPPADLAPPGGSVVHAMRYLTADEHPEPGAGRAELTDYAKVAGADPADAVEQRYLHRMVVCSVVPTPQRGGLAGRPGISSAGPPGVLVAGDWVGPEGHLADAALASGEAAGRTAARALDEGDRTIPTASR
ncbi:MAG: FAD-dependent oxidoreductase [Acidimicrobiales bacterium]|nr:FAD-dependent oxidoreductase [Acidimicrobiales bacterium]